MKLKLDENLDVRLAVILRQVGHEVATVRDQGLAGIDDQALCRHCWTARCLCLSSCGSLTDWLTSRLIDPLTLPAASCSLCNLGHR